MADRDKTDWEKVKALKILYLEAKAKAIELTALAHDAQVLAHDASKAEREAEKVLLRAVLPEAFDQYEPVS
jgi:hypothetical protein